MKLQVQSGTSIIDGWASITVANLVPMPTFLTEWTGTRRWPQPVLKAGLHGVAHHTVAGGAGQVAVLASVGESSAAATRGQATVLHGGQDGALRRWGKYVG